MTDQLTETLDRADTAIENWLLEQLEFNRECRFHLTEHKLCGRQATWLQVCRFCDRAVPFCDDHRRLLIAKDRGPNEAFACKACFAIRRTLAEVVLWVPIGDRA